MAARDRGRIVQRLEKFLESSGIKLSAVATDLTGVSARAMLEALVGGERDPKVLADLAKRTLRHKIPALIEALQGRFTEHHAFMVSQYPRETRHSASHGRSAHCPHRNRDRPFRAGTGSARDDPGDLADGRRGDHR